MEAKVYKLFHSPQKNPIQFIHGFPSHLTSRFVGLMANKENPPTPNPWRQR